MCINHSEFQVVLQNNYLYSSYENVSQGHVRQLTWTASDPRLYLLLYCSMVLIISRHVRKRPGLSTSKMLIWVSLTVEMIFSCMYRHITPIFKVLPKSVSTPPLHRREARPVLYSSPVCRILSCLRCRPACHAFVGSQYSVVSSVSSWGRGSSKRLVLCFHISQNVGCPSSPELPID